MSINMAVLLKGLIAAAGGLAAAFFTNALIRGAWYKNPFRAGLLVGCERCHSRLARIEHCPFLPWLFQRGPSRCCGTARSRRRAVVDVCCLVAAIMFAFAPPLHASGLAPSDSVRGLLFFLLHLGMVSCLMLIVFASEDDPGWGVPDFATNAGMGAGCLAGFVVPGISGLLPVSHLPHWLNGGLSSVVGMLVGIGLAEAARIFGFCATKRESMGVGVLTLMGFIGAFLGWKGAVLAFFAAPLLSLAAIPILLVLRSVWRRASIPRELNYVWQPAICGAIALYAKGYISVGGVVRIRSAYGQAAGCIALALLAALGAYGLWCHVLTRRGDGMAPPGEAQDPPADAEPADWQPRDSDDRVRYL